MQSILGNTRKTDITFHAGGRIDISARVSGLLSLRRGDVIDILDGGDELFLYVRHRAPTVGRHEAACFPTHQDSRHFRAWSDRLCHYMIKAAGRPLPCVRLSVGEPLPLPAVGTALPIIHKHVLNDDTGYKI